MTLTDMLGIFLDPLSWPFLAYVVLQVYLPLRTRGTNWFWWSLLPLLGWVPVLLMTYVGYRQESNLWPFPLIFGGGAIAAYETLFLFAFMSSKAAKLFWAEKGDASRPQD